MLLVARAFKSHTRRRQDFFAVQWHLGVLSFRFGAAILSASRGQVFSLRNCMVETVNVCRSCTCPRRWRRTKILGGTLVQRGSELQALIGRYASAADKWGSVLVGLSDTVGGHSSVRPGIPQQTWWDYGVCLYCMVPQTATDAGGRNMKE